MLRRMFDVNLSILFTELPLLERPAAARAAGFDAVEIWWPFADAVPADTRDRARSRSAIRDAGRPARRPQLLRGRHARGRSRACCRGRAGEPRVPGQRRGRRSRIAARLGCRALNALYGNFDDHRRRLALGEPRVRRRRGRRGIGAHGRGRAAHQRRTGVPDHDRPPRRSRSSTEVGRGNVALPRRPLPPRPNGRRPRRAVADHVDRIGHVQIADAPGRGEPGTGELDSSAILAKLARQRLPRATSALEYKPRPARQLRLARHGRRP